MTPPSRALHLSLVLQEIAVRLPIWNALTVAIALTFLSLAPGQETAPSAMKHVIIAPRNANRSIQIEAPGIARFLPYPSVATLKGNVSIKTPVCLPIGRNRSNVCDGYMVVRADEAEFDEKTGEIRPHGNVVVTPVYHEK